MSYGGRISKAPFSGCGDKTRAQATKHYIDSSGALAELEVFRAEDGESIRFGDLHHELPMDGPDGVKYVGFNGIYVRFPSPLNETVRLDSAEYTVDTKGKR